MPCLPLYMLYFNIVGRGSVMKKSPKSSQPETWNTVHFFHKDDSINTIKVIYFFRELYL